MVYVVAEIRGWQSPRPLQESYFFSSFLKNIYRFSLNNKIIKILISLILFSGLPFKYIGDGAKMQVLLREFVGIGAALKKNTWE
jgi:hypothetical protein